MNEKGKTVTDSSESKPAQPVEKTSKMVPVFGYRMKVFESVEYLFECYKEISMILLSAVVLFMAGMSLYNVFHMLYNGIMYNRPDLFGHDFWQALFGAIFTVLIAFEFEESFLSGFHDEDGDKNSKTLQHICPVILIGILAVVRHILTLDFEHVHFEEIASMSAIMCALSFTYYTLRRNMK